MLEKSKLLTPDCLVYDLEDGVTLERKEIARQNLAMFLPHLKHKSEILIRVNSLESGLEKEDFQVVSKIDNVKTLVLPKISTANDLKFFSERYKNHNFIVCIESALGVVNLKKICQTSNRIVALEVISI